MKINWLLRFKNKTVLLALLTCVATFVYQILGVAGVTAPVSEDVVMQYAGVALNLLVTMGVLVDPTTKGISDSNEALTYDQLK